MGSSAASRAEVYQIVRGTTERLCTPLAIEDYVVQAMPDVSPAKWHLAHTSWFFEAFLLVPSVPGYRPLDARYQFLFNSYYNAVGPQYPRSARGHLSRPTVAEVYAYRAHVDKAVLTLLESADEAQAAIVELGLHYYEADAFARWKGRRLPTEQEWEHGAVGRPLEGNLQETGLYHPRAASGGGSELRQMIGDAWEWTTSAYSPYPGFRPLAGSVGEYNGKFMMNQMVLRGGSAVTPRSHIRTTYRNFFPPEARWQFSAIRLAADV